MDLRKTTREKRLMPFFPQNRLETCYCLGRDCGKYFCISLANEFKKKKKRTLVSRKEHTLKYGTETPPRLGALWRKAIETRNDEKTDLNWVYMSTNIKNDDQKPNIIKRDPIFQSTDAALAGPGFTSGVHMWKINWPRDTRGSHAFVGVATENLMLHTASYTVLGKMGVRWGWNLTDKSAFPSYRKSVRRYPRDYNLIESEKFEPQDAFYCVLDMDHASLSFVTENGEFLGFCCPPQTHGLRGEYGALYPMVNLVWGNCEVVIEHCASLETERVHTLQHLARLTIRQELIHDEEVETLPIPQIIKHKILQLQPLEFIDPDDYGMLDSSDEE